MYLFGAIHKPIHMYLILYSTERIRWPHLYTEKYAEKNKQGLFELFDSAGAIKH